MTTAIVHAADGVRFVATAERPEIVFSQLVEYVRGRCTAMLWADASSDVRALLDDGKAQAGIALYFHCTGERWDKEHLDLVTVDSVEPWIADEECMADERR